MVDVTTEQFAQRAFDLNLVSERDLHSVWGHFGTREVPLGQFVDQMVRRGLLTNYQVERLLRGETAGFFYGDYKVLYFVGNGSFARVYRAAHKDTGKVVALKVLRKRFSEDPMELERFLREGKVGTTLRHPNIVPIYEVHSIKRTHFLVMSFVEGQSLRDFVRIRRKVEPLEATKIVAGIVAGLVYASERGVTHRDLKFSNVLISSDGQPQLVDFGLAAVSTDGRGGENYTNTRTIDYAALEKLSGVQKDDSRSDIYFTGCMFYHIMAGEPPLSETRDRTKRMSLGRFREIKPIREHIPDLPLVVEQVLNKSMELDADRRYAKPVEMLVDLRKAIKALEAAQSGEIVEKEVLEGESKTVLVIESNTAIQDALRKALKKRAYRVLVISDAERAYQRIASESGLADALIISTVLLGKEALSVFQKLSAKSSTASLPIILLLAKNQSKLLESLALAEHQRALVMPLKIAKLREILKSLLSQPASDSKA